MKLNPLWYETHVGSQWQNVTSPPSFSQLLIGRSSLCPDNRAEKSARSPSQMVIILMIMTDLTSYLKSKGYLARIIVFKTLFTLIDQICFLVKAFTFRSKCVSVARLKPSKSTIRLFCKNNLVRKLICISEFMDPESI